MRYLHAYVTIGFGDGVIILVTTEIIIIVFVTKKNEVIQCKLSGISRVSTLMEAQNYMNRSSGQSVSTGGLIENNVTLGSQ